MRRLSKGFTLDGGLGRHESPVVVCASAARRAKCTSHLGGRKINSIRVEMQVWVCEQGPNVSLGCDQVAPSQLQHGDRLPRKRSRQKQRAVRTKEAYNPANMPANMPRRGLDERGAGFQTYRLQQRVGNEAIRGPRGARRSPQPREPRALNLKATARCGKVPWSHLLRRHGRKWAENGLHRNLVPPLAVVPRIRVLPIRAFVNLIIHRPCLAAHNWLPRRQPCPSQSGRPLRHQTAEYARTRAAPAGS